MKIYLKPYAHRLEQLKCVFSGSEGNSPWSCSGIFVDPLGGLIICHGSIFSPFLLNKDQDISRLGLLLPEDFSETLQIEVLFHNSVAQYSRKANQLERQELELFPTKANLLMLVPCPEFQKTFSIMFSKSEKWQFYNEEDKVEFAEVKKDANFLHWFALLKLTAVFAKSIETVPWLPATDLQKGDLIFSCGSPFASFCPDIFMNTLSNGIVSNLAGPRNALILTDAVCLPGTEGGGIFVSKGGHLFLLGLIVSPLCWKANEWIGLTIVCSLELILQSINKRTNVFKSGVKRTAHHISTVERMQSLVKKTNMKVPILQTAPMVVLVESGSCWGSGVLMNSQLILTCRHVVNGAERVKVKIGGTSGWYAFKIIFIFGLSTKEESPYDVAVLLLNKSVCVLGFGLFGQNCGPSVTAGTLSRVMQCESKAIMLQTTCAVHAGTSGGALYRTSTGELLGIVTSNTRDNAINITYPHLNFSIAITVLKPLLHKYIISKDSSVFAELDTANNLVKNIWRLHRRQPPLPQSKI
uniref:Peroxisomal leader peptide-processing protease n=1 Tax=Erpetoichthys calabaricus TaxID=27687 RepID=A0A8C4T0C4_ERPCA